MKITIGMVIARFLNEEKSAERLGRCAESVLKKEISGIKLLTNNTKNTTDGFLYAVGEERLFADSNIEVSDNEPSVNKNNTVNSDCAEKTHKETKSAKEKDSAVGAAVVVFVSDEFENSSEYKSDRSKKTEEPLLLKTSGNQGKNKEAACSNSKSRDSISKDYKLAEKRKYDSDSLKNENIIRIKTNMDFSEAFNELQRIYLDFVEWEKQLDSAVLRSAGFQEFIDLSEDIIDSPILVYDPALKLLAYSQRFANFNDRIFQRAIANGYLEPESIEYFEKERTFDTVGKKGSAVGEADDFRDHADFARAINIRNELAVYCVMIYSGEYSREYMNQLFDNFCDYLEKLMEKQHQDFLKNRTVSDYFLADILDNPETSVEKIKERIYYNDLEYEGNYIVISLHVSGLKRSSANYLTQLLRNNMINSRIFPYHESIVILYNLPKFKADDYKEYLKDQMKHILKSFAESRFRIYFSRPITNLGQFAAAYQQAENLYEFGCGTEERKSIFAKNAREPSHNAEEKMFCFYEDHWMESLIHSLPQANKEFLYCEPFLLGLVRADTKKSRQQLEILYEYLRNDRNLTAAAEKLDMHRNNVIYHIKNIEEKSHLDLNDPDVRLRLLVSFEVLRLDVPNDATAAAIEEGRKMMADPTALRYSNMNDLKAALEE